MFTLQVPALEIALRTALIYVALLLALRLAGKREVGQLTTFDLVVILLVSNAVQNAMVGPDNSLTGGLIAAGVLLGANYLVALARDRLPWLRGLVEGSPTILIHDGRFMDEQLRREHVDVEEVLMALREHGISDPAEVRFAILETDGSISVVPNSADPPIRTRRRMRHRQRG